MFGRRKLGIVTPISARNMARCRIGGACHRCVLCGLLVSKEGSHSEG